MICVVEIIVYVMVVMMHVMVIIECVRVQLYVYLEDDDYLNNKIWK